MLRHCLLKLFTVATISWYAVGCAEPAAKLKPLPTQADYEIDHERLGDAQSEIAETFAAYDSVAASLVVAKDFQLFEGLPHHIWESKLHQAELERAKTIEIAGEPYYASPVQITNDVADSLRSLMSSRSSFIPFRGYKSCGGFHSDWCFVWTNGENSYSARICFGCGELIVDQNDRRVLHCDIWDQEKLGRLFVPLRTNRPEPQRE